MKDIKWSQANLANNKKYCDKNYKNEWVNICSKCQQRIAADQTEQKAQFIPA